MYVLTWGGLNWSDDSGGLILLCCLNLLLLLLILLATKSSKDGVTLAGSTAALARLLLLLSGNLLFLLLFLGLGFLFLLLLLGLSLLFLLLFLNFLLLDFGGFLWEGSSYDRGLKLVEGGLVGFMLGDGWSGFLCLSRLGLDLCNPVISIGSVLSLENVLVAMLSEVECLCSIKSNLGDISLERVSIC